MLDDIQAESAVEVLESSTAPSISTLQGTADTFNNEGPPSRLEPFLVRHGMRIRRLIRYSATSGISLATSEATLMALLYSSAVHDPTLAAMIGNLAGTLPSYVLSRYWIWPESDRSRAARQVILYWTISIICMAITSVATGAITNLSPRGHLLHVAMAGGAFLAFNLLLWIGKYLIYQALIFPSTNSLQAGLLTTEELAHGDH